MMVCISIVYMLRKFRQDACTTFWREVPLGSLCLASLIFEIKGRSPVAARADYGCRSEDNRTDSYWYQCQCWQSIGYHDGDRDKLDSLQTISVYWAVIWWFRDISVSAKIAPVQPSVCIHTTTSYEKRCLFYIKNEKKR